MACTDKENQWVVQLHSLSCDVVVSLVPSLPYPASKQGDRIDCGWLNDFNSPTISKPEPGRLY
jgi:hypothetical protein